MTKKHIKTSLTAALVLLATTYMVKKKRKKG